jgi:hypothetical protein
MESKLSKGFMSIHSLALPFLALPALFKEALGA